MAHPFTRAKRFKVRKPYYNDALILETQKWLNQSIIEKKVRLRLSIILLGWDTLELLIQREARADEVSYERG